MSHVFIVGFMGAGKSTVGRLVAQRLGLPFVDLDEEVERTERTSVSQIFSDRGEAAFRDLEHRVLAAASVGADSVIACGGGVVLRAENRALLAERGVVVLLEVAADEAVSRVGTSRGRPLLAGKCASAVSRLLDERRALYEQVADLRVSTDKRHPAAIADEIAAAVRADVARTRCIEVATSTAGYDVLVGEGLLSECGPRLRALTEAAKAALVSDTNVAGIFGKVVEDSLAEAGFETVPIVVEPGEASKDWATAGAVLGELASARLDRGDIVVALGGGVVGDLAGFCAATYMRGISFAQIPTTLLAQVDSAIGGKTGVDLDAGKNLAGAFWQPRLVLADTDALSSLPEGEWRSGLAEVAKAALLDSEASLQRLEVDAQGLVSRERGAVRESVRMAVALKARVVSADERESDTRECLNYGHTLGHAIEKVAGYGTIAHGLGVAEGIRFASLLSERVLGASPEFTARQERLLDALGLGALERQWDRSALIDAMRSDKKARRGAVRFVLLSAPGCFEVREVDDDVLSDTLAAWLGTRQGKEAG